LTPSTSCAPRIGAMNNALAKLSPAPEHALVDGRPVKTMPGAHTAIVAG